MAEFVASGTTVQTVAYRSPVILTTSDPCLKGYIIHRENSGQINLRGIAANPCQRYVKYLVGYSGNIAVAEGGTLGEISVGLALNGEPLDGTIAKSTPAAIGDFNNVSSLKTIKVLVGDNVIVSLENLSASQTNVNFDQNFNVIATRIA